MQHGKGGFWKEEVYAEARIMFSLFQMRPALSSWDVKGTRSYLGKNQERTSTTWDYPRGDENREGLLLLERVYL